jgi:hypothetical protein
MYDRLLEKYTVIIEKRDRTPDAGGSAEGGS